MKFALFFYFLFLYTVCFAQVQRKCSSQEKQNAYFSSGDSLRREKTEKLVAEKIQQYKSERSTFDTVTIPVVVHVIYHAPSENIPDDQIQSQIDVLNTDYILSNPDTANIPALFKPLKDNPAIQFCLASEDPNGDPTNGIERVYTDTVIWETDDDSMKFTATGGADAWDPDKYLNIWVVNIDAAYTFAYAQYPGAPPQTDGVVVWYKTFGTTGGVLYPYDKGRTTTHEIGHWFNLDHIWGADINSCDDEDHVDDTPVQKNEDYGCPEFPVSSCGNISNLFCDYMDYSDDSCISMFTTGQVLRMRAALDIMRPEIKNSTGCNNVILADHDAGIKEILSPTDYSLQCDDITMKVIIRNYGLADLHSATIQFGVVGSSMASYNWSGTLAYQEEDTLTLPGTFSTSPGGQVLTAWTDIPEGVADEKNNNDTSIVHIENAQPLLFSPDINENFDADNFPCAGCSIHNPDGRYTWVRSSVTGYMSPACMQIDNWDYLQTGETDDIVLPGFAASGAGDHFYRLDFMVAYQRYYHSGISDTLLLLLSYDCGENWDTIYRKGGDELATVPGPSVDYFVPKDASEWRAESVFFQGPCIVKFRNINEYENVIYIDNISSQLVLGLPGNNSDSKLSVYPDPANTWLNIQVQTPVNGNGNIIICNASGQIVHREKMTLVNGNTTLRTDISQLASGYYIVKLEMNGNFSAADFIIAH